MQQSQPCEQGLRATGEAIVKAGRVSGLCRLGAQYHTYTGWEAHLHGHRGLACGKVVLESFNQAATHS